MSILLKTISLIIFPIICFGMVRSNDVKNRNDKEIMDDTIKPGQFPFLVGLIANDETFVCSGSIVSEIKVLTAAHCVLQKKAKIVVAGSVDTNADNDSNEQRRNFKQYVVHPKYIKYLRTFKKKNWSNDLGMITLEKGFTLTFTVKTIPIAAVNKIPGGKRVSPIAILRWILRSIFCRKLCRKKKRWGRKSELNETYKAKCVDDERAHFSTYEVKYKSTGINGDSPLFVTRPYNSNQIICGSDVGGGAPLINRDFPYFLHGVHSISIDKESYEVSTTVPENHKWILSQLHDKSIPYMRKNGQKACKLEHFWISSVFSVYLNLRL